MSKSSEKKIPLKKRTRAQQLQDARARMTVTKAEARALASD